MARTMRCFGVPVVFVSANVPNTVLKELLGLKRDCKYLIPTYLILYFILLGYRVNLNVLFWKQKKINKLIKSIYFI